VRGYAFIFILKLTIFYILKLTFNRFDLFINIIFYMYYICDITRGR